MNCFFGSCGVLFLLYCRFLPPGTNTHRIIILINIFIITCVSLTREIPYLYLRLGPRVSVKLKSILLNILVFSSMVTLNALHRRKYFVKINKTNF